MTKEIATPDKEPDTYTLVDTPCERAAEFVGRAEACSLKQKLNVLGGKNTANISLRLYWGCQIHVGHRGSIQTIAEDGNYAR